MHKFLLTLLVIIFPINLVYAYNEHEEEHISIFADMCEKIKQTDDTISKARLRASDKAVFNAVEKLPVLELPREEFDQYDFNVLVYKLLDNYIEDLNVKTTSQDSDKICVEIQGSIKGSNIISSVMETKKAADIRAETRKQENLEGKSSLYIQKEIEKTIIKEADITPIETSIVDENIDISNSFFENLPSTATKTPKIIVEDDGDTIVIVNDNEETENRADIDETAVEDIKASVYIAPTKFFNDTKSKANSELLNKIFSNNEYFKLVDSRKNADYVVTPNILRIKIDSINNITNRMQMVAMIEMEDVEAETFYKEHQNRFTLLSVEDNEQEIAQNLMDKLMEKAGTLILSKIEASERKKNKIKTLPKIITPVN